MRLLAQVLKLSHLHVSQGCKVLHYEEVVLRLSNAFSLKPSKHQRSLRLSLVNRITDRSRLEYYVQMVVIIAVRLESKLPYKSKSLGT